MKAKYKTPSIRRADWARGAGGQSTLGRVSRTVFSGFPEPLIEGTTCTPPLEKLVLEHIS